MRGRVNRRSLLVSLAAPLVASLAAGRIAPAGSQSNGPSMFRTLEYGPGASNVGDLYLPSQPRPRVVGLLHGGFWRVPYGRDQMSSIAADLCRRGFAVWNIEYRRLGETGVGWPEIASDVLASLEFLREVSGPERRLDLDHVALVGHSAGGQLALACTSRRAQIDVPPAPNARFSPAAVVSLAGVTDLEQAFASDLGNGSTRALLGGSPDECPERYAAASPVRLLPHGSTQLLIHGANDEDVPVSQSRAYARAAVAAGDDVAYVELPGADHFAFLDPESSAHARLCEWLQGPWGARSR